MLLRLLAFTCLAVSVLSAADSENSIQELTGLAHELVRSSKVSGVSIVLVDDQSIVWKNAFGLSDKAKKRHMTPGAVFRAGSISKLFTAITAMQLAERNKLDIDKPVTDFYPDFRIVVPFPAATITLRQLMCHRSGLIRESPVGGYFDDQEPTADESIASINSCVLVYPPGTRTKYSNIGVTVVGQTAAKVAGQQFAGLADEQIFRPLKMANSSFVLNDHVGRNLAKGYMAVAKPGGDFKEIEAPPFELGTIPAGNLYTTAEDLGRFMICLFAGGRAGDRQLVKVETLEEMFRPQLTKEQTGYGLGFHVGFHGKRKKVSHTGAVYGFTSSFAALPNEKLGVVVLCNDDLATGPVRQLTDSAFDLLLRDKNGEALPALPPRQELSLEDLRQYTGEFLSESFWAKIELRQNSLHANISGQEMDLVPIGNAKFHAHGRVAWRAPINFESSHGFTALGQRFERISGQSQEIPLEWKQFIGSYGPAFIPLIITYKHNHLWAMTENEFDYRLTPVNRYEFKMPSGLYTDEQLVFQNDSNGRTHSAVLANMSLRKAR